MVGLTLIHYHSYKLQLPYDIMGSIILAKLYELRALFVGYIIIFSTTAQHYCSFNLIFYLSHVRTFPINITSHPDLNLNVVG